MKTCVLSFFLLLCKSASPQTTILAVSVQGNAYYTENEKQYPLHAGQQVNENGFILLSSGARASFLCDNYTYISIDRSGKFPVNRIRENCPSKTESFTTRYFKYVWDQLLHKHVNPEEDRKKYMNNIGGAVRGDCQSVTFNFYTDTINYHQGEFFIKWKTFVKDKSANLQLFDDGNKEINPMESRRIAGDSIELSQIANAYRNKPGIFWNIRYGVFKDCSKKYIRIWNDSDFKTFCDNYLKEFTSLGFNEAEKYFALGYFLEQRHFYADALHYYKMANALEDQNILYRMTLDEFNRAYR